MIDYLVAGILCRAYAILHRRLAAWILVLCVLAPGSDRAAAERTVVDPAADMTSTLWDFSRNDDPYFKKWPAGWKRVRDVGYPAYVTAEIQARDADFEQVLVNWDAELVRLWTPLRNWIPSLPLLPPSIADALTDRYLHIELDGGQFAAQSPPQSASRRYQYRLRCQIRTHGLRHDSARAELVFRDAQGQTLETHSTSRVTGTTAWTELSIPPVQPPFAAVDMVVRLRVERAEDGLEDIRGHIGFDNVRIDRLPQLAVTTDHPRGVYRNGEQVTASARLLGLQNGPSRIRFGLTDHTGRQVASTVRRAEIDDEANVTNDLTLPPEEEATVGTAVAWQLPPLGPGFYRVAASIEGRAVATLASETTFVVIDRLINGPPHGSFGWTLPRGREDVAPRQLAPWLAGLGVAWVKFPCWFSPADIAGAEEAAFIFSRLQDEGIETVGLLDAPPESDQHHYELRGRRDLVASQLFRNQSTWRPLLEPVMSRMTLKVRRWQLGADRDHSFLGRPRLGESIAQISAGLQGFGQPIDVAISWPWEESQMQRGTPSWQAECRSADPPLSAGELDAYLSLDAAHAGSRGPKTWLLLDPIAADRYGQTARIRDLVLRMATVRSHRVQAAFVSDPRDPQRGLLRFDGRPGELLLPWRTTARLIGNLRRTGSLQLRGGSQSMVFAGTDRAVLLLWAAKPTIERLYLGSDVQVVDVWGRVTDLPVHYDDHQPVQEVSTGPLPVFVVGADPDLLAFRMSVRLEPSKLDSLVGQTQRLTISLANPTDESLVGELRIVPPQDWSVDQPTRRWQALSGRSDSHDFEVSLGNTAMIGNYEVPIQFDLETIPPQRITVYRRADVGPYGIDLSAKTRLLDRDELLVQIELTNHTSTVKAFDCLLFPPGRQFQARVITVDAKLFLARRRRVPWQDNEAPGRGTRRITCRELPVPDSRLAPDRIQPGSVVPSWPVTRR